MNKELEQMIKLNSIELKKIFDKPYRVLQVNSTNDRFNYKNQVGILNHYNPLAITFNLNKLDGGFYHTSYITKVQLKGKIIQIFTRNSLYEFRGKSFTIRFLTKSEYKNADKDNLIKVLFELSDKDKNLIESFLKSNFV